MKTLSNKPYLIRAIYEWCMDSGLTPYLAVKVNAQTRVPTEHVKDGEIVLNISPSATHRLTIADESIEFSARFNGTSREISIPMGAVTGIFAKENAQGLAFSVSDVDVVGDVAQEAKLPVREGVAPSKGGKPKFKIIK